MMNIKILALAFMMLPLVAQAQGSQPRFSDVYSPEIPSSVKLCGDNIDLDRSDLYERFDRELSSIIYTHGTTM